MFSPSLTILLIAGSWNKYIFMKRHYFILRILLVSEALGSALFLDVGGQVLRVGVDLLSELG